METFEIEEQPKEKEAVKKRHYIRLSVILLSAGISLFWVIFLWGFIEKGTIALGFNATIFLILILLLFQELNPNNKLYAKKNFQWFIPLSLVMLSFSLYENPFIKIVTIFIYPIIFTLFYNYSMLQNREKINWDHTFFGALVVRLFQFLAKFADAIGAYSSVLIKSSDNRKSNLKRVLLGITILMLVSFFIIIPLLSAADKIFAEKVEFLIIWFQNLLSETTFAKVVVFLFLAVVFLAMGIAWKKPFKFKNNAKETKQVDSIVSGIIISGILLLYILFLSIQVKYLWVNELPVNFNVTESLVKSGFWQLFTLTVINLGIFFVSFQKTNKFVQKILLVFTGASFLLLGSAAQRMIMYVTYYGFSYEKFYALYTVLFCGILLIWLLSRFFIKKRANIIKAVCFLFLWMFAIVTILPVERFVIQSNVALAELSKSRIKLYELTMLSNDVLGYVEENKDYFYQTENYSDINDVKKYDTWALWVFNQNKILREKKFYEMNLSNIFQNQNSD